jgi:hypothetical protein
MSLGGSGPDTSFTRRVWRARHRTYGIRKRRGKLATCGVHSVSVACPCPPNSKMPVRKLVVSISRFQLPSFRRSRSGREMTSGRVGNRGGGGEGGRKTNGQKVLQSSISDGLS